MDDISASKLIPTTNIQATVHSKFPIEKWAYIDHSIDNIEENIIYPESTDLEQQAPIEFVIHETAGHYIDLESIQIEVKLEILDADGNRAGI